MSAIVVLFAPMEAVVLPVVKLPLVKLLLLKHDNICVYVGVNLAKLNAVKRLAKLVTDIFPNVAPAGTFTVKLVEDAEVGVDAFTPPKNTTLLAAVLLKFVPVMVTEEPTAAVIGLKVVIEGT
jgi:hypothetical protein